MKFFFAILFVWNTPLVWAEVPEPVITVGEVQGRFAVVAGKLAQSPGKAVGVSVLNGNIISSTLTDGEGRWSVVIRHLSNQVSASSWDLNRPEDKSKAVSRYFSNQDFK